MVERHHVLVNAPDSTIARLLFNARALALGGRISRAPMVQQPFVEQAQAIGWRVLAEIPGSEIVFGADRSIFRTETRVSTTDEAARRANSDFIGHSSNRASF